MFVHLKNAIYFFGLLFIINCCDTQAPGPCKDGFECKSLLDCPPIKDNFRAKQNEIVICNPVGTIVCCPKRIVLPQPSSNDLFHRSEQECLKYRSVYGNCPEKPFIVNGWRVEEGEFPFVAALGIRNNDSGYIDWKCTGTLVTPKYVLSAAHCFFISKILNHVSLGDLDHSTTADDAHRQDFSIEKYILHPDYDDERTYNDIVVVMLNGTAQLNRFVTPACLPLSSGGEYTHFLAAGWGSSSLASGNQNQLMKTQVELFADEECKLKIIRTEANDEGVVERTQICAGSHGDRNDTCEGDSGGPLFVQHPRYPCLGIVVGVTSYGSACGTPGVPGVYTRMQKYVPWVERILWPN